jgi:hypothetical protein
MRYRSWLLLSLLAASAVMMAGPAAAQSGGYGTSDQIGMVSTMQSSLAPAPHHRPDRWLDVGTVLPITEFQDRGWTAGFGLRFTQEFVQRSSYSLLGSLGLNWVNMTRFNEQQTDANFERPLGQPQGPVESVKWLGVPYSLEIQWEPTAESRNSFFFSGGPAGQITRESKTLQESLIRDWTYSVDERQDYLVTGSGEALYTTQAINKTKFNLGYVLHAGFRGKVGGGYDPLYMRIVAGWNVWYERSAPVSMITAALSFGR